MTTIVYHPKSIDSVCAAVMLYKSDPDRYRLSTKYEDGDAIFIGTIPIHTEEGREIVIYNNRKPKPEVSDGILRYDYQHSLCYAILRDYKEKVKNYKMYLEYIDEYEMLTDQSSKLKTLRYITYGMASTFRESLDTRIPTDYIFAGLKEEYYIRSIIVKNNFIKNFKYIGIKNSEKRGIYINADKHDLRSKLKTFMNTFSKVIMEYFEVDFVLYGNLYEQIETKQEIFLIECENILDLFGGSLPSGLTYDEFKNQRISRTKIVEKEVDSPISIYAFSGENIIEKLVELGLDQEKIRRCVTKFCSNQVYTKNDGMLTLHHYISKPRSIYVCQGNNILSTFGKYEFYGYSSSVSFEANDDFFNELFNIGNPVSSDSVKYFINETEQFDKKIKMYRQAIDTIMSLKFDDSDITPQSIINAWRTKSSKPPFNHEEVQRQAKKTAEIEVSKIPDSHYDVSEIPFSARSREILKMRKEDIKKRTADMVRETIEEYRRSNEVTKHDISRRRDAAELALNYMINEDGSFEFRKLDTPDVKDADPSEDTDISFFINTRPVIQNREIIVTHHQYSDRERAKQVEIEREITALKRECDDPEEYRREIEDLIEICVDDYKFSYATARQMVYNLAYDTKESQRLLQSNGVSSKPLKAGMTRIEQVPQRVSEGQVRQYGQSVTKEDVDDI